MRPDEGAALARCFYRVYGYSYGEFLYYPEKVRELLESGLQTSLAAVTPAGEIGLTRASFRMARSRASQIPQQGQHRSRKGRRGHGFREGIVRLRPGLQRLAVRDAGGWRAASHPPTF